MTINKKTILISIALISSLLSFGQNQTSLTTSRLDKIVIDLSAKPIHYTTNGNGSLESYSCALGYELSDKLDLRFNLDFIDFFDRTSYGYYYSGVYQNYKAMMLGVKYDFISDFNSIFKLKSDLSIVAKAGININDYQEMEGFVFDVSMRLDFNSAPYIGFGYDRHYFVDHEEGNIGGLYFTFGFDF